MVERNPTGRLRLLLASAGVVALCVGPTSAQQRMAPEETADRLADDPLTTGFRDPPQQVRAQAWWHWQNGNVTEAGIKADLDWMRRVGIGGAHYFDAGGPIFAPSFIEPRILVGDARWRSAVRFAVNTADRLGLEMTTAASPGWSITGGPWVRPEQAMKKYVWSETIVQGGHRFSGTLTAPPRRAGVFQDAPRGVVLGSTTGDGPEFYADALVAAYRLPDGSADDPGRATLTSSSGAVDARLLSDGRLAESLTVTGLPGQKAAWVAMSYPRRVTIRALSLGMAGRAASEGDVKPAIEISDDGRDWRPGVTLSGPADAPLKTYAFSPLTARHFRIMLPPEPPPPSYQAAFVPHGEGERVKVALAELALHGEPRVDRFAEKAGFAEPIIYGETPTPAVASRLTIAHRDVIDLTGRMAADGTLDWTPPKGRWLVIRLGYSLTGRQNAPAAPEATGLEVDKFSPIHIRDYLATYLRRYEDAAGPEMVGPRGISSLLTDSWEAGSQNWTEDMATQFQTRRGYSLLPWLPVLTGRVVDSAEASDRFLFDFRRTAQDLLAQHYAIVRDELHKRGMRLYAEAQGDNWRALADGMEIKSRADIPMAEYWFRPFAAGPGQPSLKTDLKEAASVAHLYGKPLAASESLTVASSTPWAYAPAHLKPVIDEIFAYGINRFVLHTSVHQPLLGRRPGLALGPFGQYINRNETWAEQAKPFFDYIARASHLLQQGRYVADVAYFYGESRPLVSLFKTAYDPATDRYIVEVPAGTGYDFINAETLREATSVAGSELTTSGGMRYRILFLGPDTRAMTLATLDRLETLVRGGVVLVGRAPEEKLGLAGTDAEFRETVARLWGAGDAVRSVGRGRIYPAATIAEALAAEGIAPDVALDGAKDANILQIHRRTADGRDIYFLTNRRPRAEVMTATFRAAGRRPYRWDANTGTRTPLAFRVAGGRTVVDLAFSANDSAFVVFDEATAEASGTAPPLRVTTLGTLAGPWEVRFPPDLGAPPRTTLPALASWSENADDGVRHFSGTATYVRTVVVPRDWRHSGRRIMLDLGDVREVAQVLINGRDTGILWKPPYRTDVTDALNPGRNSIEIRVTNLWPNRIIGDLQPGVSRRITWTTSSPLFARNQWKADSPLLPSGLLGPVRIEAEDSDPAQPRIGESTRPYRPFSSRIR